MQEQILSPDVVLEAELLKAFSIKENYLSYNHVLDYKRLLPNTSLLLKDYKEYFDIYPSHTEVNWGIFYTHFSQNWHIANLTTPEIEYYRDYVFPTVRNSRTANTTSCIVGLIKKKTLDDLANISGELNPDKIRIILDEFEQSTSNILQPHDTEICKIDTVDFTELDKANGIPFFLPTLQDGLGSLVKGQFVIVSADYGTGKSAFVISQAVHTLIHLHKTNDERPILYFNSEGTSADIFGRFCSNLFKDKLRGGFEEVIVRAEEVKESFLKTFSANQFLVIQMMSSSIDWLHTKIKKYNPALVIIDITDTLAPEEDVMNLKKVYDRLRLLSGTYCPIIGTTQSGDTSYKDSETGEIKNKKWLNDKALYGSKTGKGGSADSIITIGKDDANKNLRYITTPKKKRGKEVYLTCELVDIYSLYKELKW